MKYCSFCIYPEKEAAFRSMVGCAGEAACTQVHVRVPDGCQAQRLWVWTSLGMPWGRVVLALSGSLSLGMEILQGLV